MPPSSKSTNWSWYRIWAKAILNPTLEAFEEIAFQANKRQSYNWLFIGSLAFALPMNLTYLPQEVCARVILTALALTFLLIIFIALLNAMAKAFGGDGNYERYCFTVAAFMAPIGILTGILSMIFRQHFILVLLGLYALCLGIVSMKAVHHLSWSKSFVVNFTISLSLLLLALSLLQHYVVFMMQP